MTAVERSWPSTVETERLILRPWEEADLYDLAAVFARPEVWRFPFGRGFTRDEAATFMAARMEEWRDRGWSHWAVVVRSDQRLIGFLGLNPPGFLPEVMPAVEVGWRIHPDYWGRGLATEGGRAALRFGFEELGLPAIVSVCQPENVASWKVMEHLGMARHLETVHPTMGLALWVYRIGAEQWRAGR